MTTPPLPTYRLLDGTRREIYTPKWQERHDPDADEYERQEREDRMREKGE